MKNHINITKATMTLLTVSTPLQTNTTQLIQTNTNANYTTQMIKKLNY